jgi:hypothetical protein
MPLQERKIQPLNMIKQILANKNKLLQIAHFAAVDFPMCKYSFGTFRISNDIISGGVVPAAVRCSQLSHCLHHWSMEIPNQVQGARERGRAPSRHTTR